MESVGLLAGGIAHDLNNLLSPIIGYSELLQMGLVPDGRRYEYLGEVRRAGERARKLTRQLLAFSRRQVLELRVLHLGAVVRHLEPMLRRTIREHIRIEIRVTSENDLVRADQGEIERVVMNLAVNALDAMPAGGLLAIDVEDVELSPSNASSHPGVRPGPYVALAIKDTGTGMSEETLRHLFEPFFTTKGTDKGTGLGLSTAYGIVSQHGGYMTVDSTPGVGSVFRAFLPRAEGAATVAHPTSSAEPRAAQGSETVLVVEDNELVRNLACDLLHALGYTVRSADGPAACFALVEKLDTTIDLLLTDVIMPEMNGVELYQRLQARLPHLKVVYMSGYPKSIIDAHGVIQEGLNLIQKPLTVGALSERIRTVLGR